MAWPIIAGALAGIGGMFLGGASKKEGATYHAPYETYAPTTSYQIQYPDYNIVMDSPFGTAGSKKEQAAEQTPTISPVGGAQTTGTDMTMLVLIGGAALIGYGLVSKK